MYDWFIEIKRNKTQSVLTKIKITGLKSLSKMLFGVTEKANEEDFAGEEKFKSSR